jgi:hypothetical protein
LGLLTDVFAATESEVRGLAPDDYLPDQFPSVKSKALDPVKFGVLQNILLGTEVQTAVKQHELMYEVSEDGPWVFRIPAELSGVLATMNGQHLDDAAKKWSRTQEFQLDHWDYVDVADVLRKIAQLARQARSDGQSLFVWVCL